MNKNDANEQFITAIYKLIGCGSTSVCDWLGYSITPKQLDELRRIIYKDLAIVYEKETIRLLVDHIAFLRRQLELQNETIGQLNHLIENPGSKAVAIREEGKDE